MPHLVFEASAELALALDFRKLLRSIHEEFAEQGYAKASTIRSRVVIPEFALSGTDENEQFVIATMKTTVPRPVEMEQAMAQCVHDAIRSAIEASAFCGPWQCGVFRESVPDERFVKSNGRN